MNHFELIHLADLLYQRDKAVAEYAEVIQKEATVESLDEFAGLLNTIDELTDTIAVLLGSDIDMFLAQHHYVGPAIDFLGCMADVEPLNFLYFREWAMKHPDQHIECHSSARECMMTHYKAALTKLSKDREYLAVQMNNCGPDAIDAVVTEYTNLLETTVKLQQLGHEQLNLPLPTSLV